MADVHARPKIGEPLGGPTQFGPYTLIAPVGAGGMGEVFLAQEREGGRRVCVVKKVLKSLLANEVFVGRFRDEARVVTLLRHPNIASVYGIGEFQGQRYLAMEYVRGKTLSRVVHRIRSHKKRLQMGLTLLIAERVCQGLVHAHTAKDEHGNSLNLVHRDLSPANVVLSYSGEVKIIDFGAAQSLLKEQRTAPRVVIGSLAYMAPEQARKQKVDCRADLYSVGAILWELLSWQRLPQKGDPVERWRRAAYPVWTAPSEKNDEIPPDVDAMVVRAVSRSPELRFQDAASFAAELRRLRRRYAPGIGDGDLSALMSEFFAQEKAQEEVQLQKLMEERTRILERQERESTILIPAVQAPQHGLDNPGEPHSVVARLDNYSTSPLVPSLGPSLVRSRMQAARWVGGAASGAAPPIRSLSEEIDEAAQFEKGHPRTFSWASYAAVFVASLLFGFVAAWVAQLPR